MGATDIEWADESWNPITGCAKLSTGCQNCYAERMTKRLGGRFGYPADKPFSVVLHKDKLNEPLRWEKKPRKVFVCSMGDLFHDEVQPEWLAAVLAVIRLCPQHQFYMLTKRPYNIATLWGAATAKGCAEPPRNVLLGFSAEDQTRYDERHRYMRVLTDKGWRIWCSIEPMLTPVNVTGDLSWVVCGGETGPGARPMRKEWALALRDQCDAFKIPFFFKQSGDNSGTWSNRATLDGVAHRVWPQLLP